MELDDQNWKGVELYRCYFDLKQVVYIGDQEIIDDVGIRALMGDAVLRV